MNDVMWTISIALLLMSSADWPRFRGPNGSGVSEATGLPDRFGASGNLVWRAPVPPGRDRHRCAVSPGREATPPALGGLIDTLAGEGDAALGVDKICDARR